MRHKILKSFASHNQRVIIAVLCTFMALTVILLQTTMRRISITKHALTTDAAVTRDYKRRNALISFWESEVHENGPSDQISPRQLADQYLQRFRETGDIGDVTRARAAAEASLRAQRNDNLAAELTLADVDLTLHRFYSALARIRRLELRTDLRPQLAVREAGLDLEVGQYKQAHSLLEGVPTAQRDDGWHIVRSRELEETGRLADAQRQFAIAATDANALIDAPAQRRAWFFFRAGEMAFSSGKLSAAEDSEIRALSMFPGYADASRALARMQCAQKEWTACLVSATRSAAVIPYPETLGLKADAQAALGDVRDAVATQDMISIIERIGNADHISDRLLAVEYSEHGIRLNDAYCIAQRELRTRDDIFTEDTLAWAAAMSGRWNIARDAMRRAIQFNTEDALLQYHAGVIARHFGDIQQARYRFERSLRLNPSFHARYSDDARLELSQIG